MASPVIGGDELRRAFATAGTSFNKEMKTRLKGYAEPVRVDAERLAQARIRGISPAWSRMRTGAATNLVYVAPVMRSTRIASRKRPRFARLLLTRAMEPALDKNRDQIAAKIDTLLARMERKFGVG